MQVETVTLVLLHAEPCQCFVSALVGDLLAQRRSIAVSASDRRAARTISSAEHSEYIHSVALRTLNTLDFRAQIRLFVVKTAEWLAIKETLRPISRCASRSRPSQPSTCGK